MKQLAIVATILMSLGCTMGKHKQPEPTLISQEKKLVSVRLVDLQREDWLVYETTDPPKLKAIEKILLEAEMVDEKIADQQQFSVQLRLTFEGDTTSSFMYGQTTGDLCLGSIKKTRSFRLENPNRLNALLRE